MAKTYVGTTEIFTPKGVLYVFVVRNPEADDAVLDALRTLDAASALNEGDDTHVDAMLDDIDRKVSDEGYYTVPGDPIEED